MTLDDASGILNITEKSVVRLVRQRKIFGQRVLTNGGWTWMINGRDVQRRAHLLAKRAKGGKAR